MKIGILKNALDTIKLLLILNIDNSISSGELRNYFMSTKPHTLDGRINNFVQQGFVEKIYKKDISKRITPGGDKFEYKLTKKGLKARKSLIVKTLKILEPTINQIVAQKLKVSENIETIPIKDRQELIEEISTNISMDVLEILQDFFKTIIADIDKYIKEHPTEIINNTLKKIQLIYQKEIQDSL